MLKIVSGSIRLCLLIICCFSVFQHAISQNLILNGSFEKLDTSRVYFNSIEFAAPWLGPGSKIYSKFPKHRYILPSDFDAPDGENFSGILVRAPDDRQILVAKFSETLKPGKRYELSFFYRLKPGKSDKWLRIKYCFSQYMDADGSAPYSVNKHINCNGFVAEKDPAEWHFFKETIRSEGHENYLLIWNTDTVNIRYRNYIFLDAFKLIELDAPVSEPVSPAIKNDVISTFAQELSDSLQVFFEGNMFQVNHTDSLRIVDFTKKYNSDRFTIVLRGLTDTTGTTESNSILARERILSVQRIFLNEQFFGTVDFLIRGEDHSGLEKTGKGNSEFRRVDILIYARKDRNGSNFDER